MGAIDRRSVHVQRVLHPQLGQQRLVRARGPLTVRDASTVDALGPGAHD
jgi:hypothetical protein